MSERTFDPMLSFAKSVRFDFMRRAGLLGLSDPGATFTAYEVPDDRVSIAVKFPSEVRIAAVVPKDAMKRPSEIAALMLEVCIKRGVLTP